MVTKGKLAAIAGWAVARSGDGGPSDEAMRKLRDGCEAAIPFAPDAEAVAKPAKRPVQRPAEVRRHPPHVLTCTNGGSHQYDIRTQRCVFCSRTYLDIVGHQPEFMGK